MALYRHLATGTTPGEVFNWSLWTDGEISLTAAQSAWEGFLTTYLSGPMAALFSADVVTTGASTAEITVATGRQVTRVDGGVNLPGTSTADMLPFQCAEVVSLRTFFTAATARGRFYLPPMSVAHVTNGRLTAAAVGTVADATQNMLLGLPSAGLTPVVYSRTARAAVTINRIKVDDVIDTQRRRRNKLVGVSEERNV